MTDFWNATRGDQAGTSSRTRNPQEVLTLPTALSAGACKQFSTDLTFTPHTTKTSACTTGIDFLTGHAYRNSVVERLTDQWMPEKHALTALDEHPGSHPPSGDHARSASNSACGGAKLTVQDRFPCPHRGPK
ncbi:hypothetical protein [Streptomyces mexicanus]|uniref:Uncharacterized protein n=1 Tax=Streptomyces mexicanus TaxID=178566 RepID=A0A7X1LR79_9ACTN|nr:hypothetical protein [Streptomyces mexicanus]MBC2866860.1 hypothetical protein [Streptomyces mexicanus]